MADQDARGAIATAPSSVPQAPVTTPLKRFTLEMTDPNDGLMLFRPAPGRKVARQMTVAPEGGYERLVTVSPDDATGAQLDTAHFFVRIGGKFGRGFVTARVERDGRAEFHVRFFMQRDGSTNLEDDAAAPYGQ
jgi:hypothetical protein